MKKLLLPILFVCVNIASAMASGHTVTIPTYSNVSCNGMCNGSATASISGGVGPFSYNWSPSGGTGATANTLCAGSYTIIVTDSSDMSTATAGITISEPSALIVSSITSSGGSAICNGTCTTLSPIVTGGSLPYNYTWSNGVSSASQSVCPAATTNYTVTVSDAHGCTASASITITVNPSAIIVNSPTICSGSTATLTASGATTYSWSTGDLTSSINVSPFSTATYTVVGTTSGCTGTAVTTVTVTSTPTITVNSPTICAGTTVTLTAFGGATYLWNTGATTNSINVTPSFSTSYIVTGTTGGCSSTVTSTVTVMPPPAVTVNSPTICTGTMATLIASGATSYTWSAGATPTGVNTATASPVVSTTYTVTGTSGLCTASAISTVTVGPIPVLTFTTVDPTCGLCNGSVTPVVSGGGPYTFSWTGPSGSGSGGSPLITSACAGTFTVTVTNMMGCTAINVCTLTNISVLTTSISSTTISACGACDGIATVTPTGGSGPYSYLWNDPAGQTTSTATGLCGGHYTVTVTDAGSGCSSMSATNIVTSSPPVIVLDSIKDKHCDGVSLGAIYTHGTGGTPVYSYLWSNGATTPSITGLNAGTYGLTLSDTSGCSSVDSFTIVIHPLHAIFAGYTSANCTSDGSYQIIGGGSYPPFTYLWNDPLHQTTSNATLPMGGYICSITDSMGCVCSAAAYVNSSCYNIIQGNIYNDVNGNCIHDAGESGIPGVSVYTNTGYYGYTNILGDYAIFTYSLSNIVTQILPPYSTQLCPAGSIVANFATFGGTISGVDFADQYTASINDLTISFYPGTARPGFSQSCYINYKNVGTTTISAAVVTLTVDSILTGFASYPLASSYTYPTATWNVGTLIPGQSGWISAWYNVPTIPLGGYLGRVLHYTAHIDPIIGDATPPNNTDIESTSIVGSWDPNSKEVSPSGNITAADSVLKYTINFQNTGTDTAFTVVLKDTLSQYLDPATVVPGIASAPYTFNIAFDGELTWTFSNILLPDSAGNETASHGFATFTVRQKQSNSPGTHIDNTADIYFDFNPAVVTNTVSNMVINVTTGIETTSTNAAVKVYPNPFSDNTTFVIQSDKLNETYSFELTDVLGKNVKSINGISEKQFQISRSGLENGIYFYEIYSSESIIGVGKLVIK